MRSSRVRVLILMTVVVLVILISLTLTYAHSRISSYEGVVQKGLLRGVMGRNLGFAALGILGSGALGLGVITLLMETKKQRPKTVTSDVGSNASAGPTGDLPKVKPEPIVPQPIVPKPDPEVTPDLDFRFNFSSRRYHDTITVSNDSYSSYTKYALPDTYLKTLERFIGTNTIGAFQHGPFAKSNDNILRGLLRSILENYVKDVTNNIYSTRRKLGEVHQQIFLPVVLSDVAEMLIKSPRSNSRQSLKGSNSILGLMTARWQRLRHEILQVERYVNLTQSMNLTQSKAFYCRDQVFRQIYQPLERQLDEELKNQYEELTALNNTITYINKILNDVLEVYLRNIQNVDRLWSGPLQKGQFMDLYYESLKDYNTSLLGWPELRRHSNKHANMIHLLKVQTLGIWIEVQRNIKSLNCSSQQWKKVSLSGYNKHSLVNVSSKQWKKLGPSSSRLMQIFYKKEILNEDVFVAAVALRKSISINAYTQLRRIFSRLQQISANLTNTTLSNTL